MPRKKTDVESTTKRQTFIMQLQNLDTLKKYSFYTEKNINDIVNEALREYFENHHDEFTKAVELELKSLKKKGEKSFE